MLIDHRGWQHADNLPDPDVHAREIAEDPDAALDQFATIAHDLSERSPR
jgi:hypothetical protein